MFFRDRVVEMFFHAYNSYMVGIYMYNTVRGILYMVYILLRHSVSRDYMYISVVVLVSVSLSPSVWQDYAYPADELMPLSCKGRVRGIDRSRGSVDEALGG